MLEINQQFFEIQEALDELVQTILQQEQVSAYRLARQAFDQDQKLQQEIADFQKLQASYEEQKDYIHQRPEVRLLRRQVFAAKRQLDQKDKVLALRQCEFDLQELLSRVSESLAQAISLTIFVDKGLPLSASRPSHASGRGNNIKEKESYARTSQ